MVDELRELSGQNMLPQMQADGPKSRPHIAIRMALTGRTLGVLLRCVAAASPLQTSHNHPGAPSPAITELALLACKAAPSNHQLVSHRQPSEPIALMPALT